MDRLQSSADSAAREPPAGSPGASGTAPRAPAGGRLLNQRCQHCGVDLIDHKRFYKRYRVCEKDALAPSLMLGGQLQRFCQQCGRFHPLAYFDGIMRTCREQLARHASLKRKRRREQAMLRNGGAPLGSARHARDNDVRPAKHQRQQQVQGPRSSHQEQLQLERWPSQPPLEQQLEGWPLALLQSLAGAGPGLSADAAAALSLRQPPLQRTVKQEEQQLRSAFANSPAKQQGCFPGLGALLGLDGQPSVNSRSELQQALMACWPVNTPSPQPQPTAWLPSQPAPLARPEPQEQAHHGLWSAWHQAAAAPLQAARQRSWPLEQQSCGTRFDPGESLSGLAAPLAPAPTVQAPSCSRQNSEELLLAGLCSLLQATVAELQQASTPQAPPPPPPSLPAADVVPLHNLLAQIAAVNPALATAAALNTHADTLGLAALQHLLGQH